MAPRRNTTPIVRTIIPADMLVSATDRSFAFTPGGRGLAYVSSDARQIFVRPLDALEPVAILTTAAYIRGMCPSPDGRWFAFVENNFTLKKISSTGGAAVTLHLGVGATVVLAVRITVAQGIDWFPVWTPDGRRIAFGSWRGGRFSNLYRLDLTTGATDRLTDSPDMQLPTSITPDGTTLIFHTFMKGLQALRLDSGREPTTLVETPGEERNGELSPDGRWPTKARARPRPASSKSTFGRFRT